jgi:predicted RecB family nuclease
MSKLIFTPSLFFQYATCPHWLWHEKYSDLSLKGETPALMEKLLEQGVLHEEKYVKDLTFVEVEEKRPESAFAHTLELMKEGVELIYQGEIQYEADGVVYRGRPDLLERRIGKTSTFGDFYYVPCDIKSSSDIKKEQWMQLTLYAKILEELQGVFPDEVSIINRNHERVQFSIEEKHRVKTFDRADTILRVLKGEKPPLKLSSSCKSSPWYSQCVKEAEDVNDIALLYRLDSRAHERLRENGISTVEEAAEMNIDTMPKIPYASPQTLQRVKLQALSLLSGELKWVGSPELPETPLNIYFDIEGDPLLDVQYLWGFWVAGDPEGKYADIGHVRKHDDGQYFVYFLAEQPEDEREMWHDFLKWLDTLPQDGYTVWHYNKYERVQCEKLAKLYGDSDSLRRFMSNFIDLEIVVRDSVIFPLYFYSIKDIAKSKFLNFQWRHAKAGGAQSIFWYEEWLEKNDRNILNDIVNYNEDDVRATEFLRNWLVENQI